MALPSWSMEWLIRGHVIDALLLIPVALDTVPACDAEPSLAPPASAPCALVRFADGTRLEIGADYPTPALTALIAALTGRR
ncbi:hypothetical protein ABNQ39_26670 [Azospirillum sp. A26]|uniref:hypothetical protein n=1 Tax=Azospirillum sp. A26 TaxID=3160607 RepID=UPI00366FEE23